MEEKHRKIIVFAVADNGEGKVMEIGRFESIEDISIIIGMFSKDVVINLEYEGD